jgi:hypothetical protein
LYQYGYNTRTDRYSRSGGALRALDGAARAALSKQKNPLKNGTNR